MGQIDHRHLDKLPPEMSMLVVKIGGPAYRIGMGGGAASSVPSGSREGAQAADLDFNAVQVPPPCLQLAPVQPGSSVPSGSPLCRLRSIPEAQLLT